MSANVKHEKWEMPEWMEEYRHMFQNTGGNTIENLLNDHTTNAFSNSIRFALIITVQCQVMLLWELYNAGKLRRPKNQGLFDAKFIYNPREDPDSPHYVPPAEKLKACPKCGEPNDIHAVEYPIVAENEWTAECGGCSFSIGMCRTKEQATEDWNNYPRPEGGEIKE